MSTKSNQTSNPNNISGNCVSNFFAKHKKILTISATTLLTLGFAGSIVYSVFSGGELIEVDNQENKIKGLIKLSTNSYSTSYFENDPFSFDKEANKVTLVAKDPAIENIVQVNDLPGPEYGFIVSKTVDENGNIVDEDTISKTKAIAEDVQGEAEGEATPEEENKPEEKPNYEVIESEFYENASDIIMKKDMGSIYLVSKRYPDLRTKLNTEIVGTLDESKLINTVNFEAETAKVYQDDKLLTQEELQTKPEDAKPFLSNYGTSPIVGEEAEALSGKVCLRNFNNRNMKVDFEVVSSKTQEVELTLKVCKRPKADVFGNFFKTTVNGKSYDAIDALEVEKGTGYYQPTTLETVKVTLTRGINHITFASGSKAGTGSPVNLDALIITTADNSIGLTDVIKAN